jgi:hypothetical protein
MQRNVGYWPRSVSTLRIHLIDSWRGWARAGQLREVKANPEIAHSESMGSAIAEPARDSGARAHRQFAR